MDHESLFASRVPDVEAGRVQEEPGKSVGLPKELVDPALSVLRAADDLVGEVGEVASDLAVASGANPHSQE